MGCNLTREAPARASKLVSEPRYPFAKEPSSCRTSPREKDGEGKSSCSSSSSCSSTERSSRTTCGSTSSTSPNSDITPHTSQQVQERSAGALSSSISLATTDQQFPCETFRDGGKQSHPRNQLKTPSQDKSWKGTELGVEPRSALPVTSYCSSTSSHTIPHPKTRLRTRSLPMSPFITSTGSPPGHRWAVEEDLPHRETQTFKPTLCPFSKKTSALTPLCSERNIFPPIARLSHNKAQLQSPNFFIDSKTEEVLQPYTSKHPNGLKYFSGSGTASSALDAGAKPTSRRPAVAGFKGFQNPCAPSPTTNPTTPAPATSGIEPSLTPVAQNKSSASPDTTTASTGSSTSSSMAPGLFIQRTRAELSDKYVRERRLGTGACGEVLLCRDRETGCERAVKVIKKATISIDSDGGDILREVSVLKQLDHPNIMKLYEFFEDRKHYYLVSEVYKGGELFDEIVNRHRFTEVDAARTIKQVLSGVTYLHKYKTVHRDLKPENLLLESRDRDALIKIVDFGLSFILDPKKKMRDRLGTAYYIAPEVLKQKYDEKCDIWSCGVILYILLCGYPPFSGATDREVLQRVGKGKFYFEYAEWCNVSDAAKDLITRMLTFDPTKRISAERCLQHPWIRDYAEKAGGAVASPSLFKALGNMRKFQASQKLAQAALLFMGSKLTTLDETKELTSIFRNLDRNGDGQLDREELVEGYKQLLHLRENADAYSVSSMTKQQIEQEVDRILETVDFDKNGFIEYSEFVTVAMDRTTLLSRSRLQAAFRMFDTDGSGKIALDELKQILTDVDDTHWHEIMREVDLNNDGEVDYDEFVQMMQNLHIKDEFD